MPFSALHPFRWSYCWSHRRSRRRSYSIPVSAVLTGLMMTILRALVCGGICLVLSVASLAQTPVSPQISGIADPSLDARVDSLLQRMTLEEKVGQLVQYSAGQPTGPGTGRTDYEDMIARGQIGSLFNVVDPHAINKYQKIAMEKARLHIPILFGLDVIHGFKTEFPIPLGLASTWDPSIVEKASRVAAMEASADGIRWTFSPMVDIARDARWGRMAEGAGEDPFLGSAIAAAYVRGYQGSRLDAPDSIAACAKHYVGYGAAEGGRDYNTTEISEHTLRQFYLPPFHAAVEAGTASLMSAFNSLNGVPSSANSFTLKQVLRKEWGFRGIVVSDWDSIGELIPHGIAPDGATAARKAFLAGVDMDMVSSVYHENLQKLASSGHATENEVTEAEIDNAVRHHSGRRCSLPALQRLRSAVLAGRPGNRRRPRPESLMCSWQGTWSAERQPGLLPGRQGPIRSPGRGADLCRGNRPRRTRHAALQNCARTRLEKDPLDCHRALLVARRLSQTGVSISHIHADGTLESHQAMESRVLAACKLPEGDLLTSREEFIDDAYRIRGERVAYRDKTAEQDEQQVEEDAAP